MYCVNHLILGLSYVLCKSRDPRYIVCIV